MRQQGDLARAVDLLAQGLAIYREEQNPDGIAASLLRLQEVAHDREDHEEAALLFAEAMNWARRVADPRNAPSPSVTWRTYPGYREISTSPLPSIARFSIKYGQVADSQTIGGANCVLGDLARMRDDYDTAEEFYRRSLELAIAVGHGQWIASRAVQPGICGAVAGRDPAGGGSVQRALQVFSEMEYRVSTADSIAALAGVAAAVGEPQRAARLFGAAEAMFAAGWRPPVNS